MKQKPRAKTTGLLTRSEWTMSIIQGLVISAGTLGLYFYFIKTGAGIDETRNIVFTTLILSNFFLTFAGRSFTKNFLHTIRYRNSLTLYLVATTAIFLCILHLVPFVRNLFQLKAIFPQQFFVCLVIAFLSVAWFELYKTLAYPSNRRK